MTKMTWLRALLTSKPYPHSTQAIKHLETHVSWIFLTGEYAYKIKKPVDFGFLDFSTLEKRKFFCEKELLLNKPLAPETYLSVVAITGTMENPHIEGEGAILEYALKMRQFPDQALLSVLIQKNQLDLNKIIQLAKVIAHFHQTTSRATSDSPFGTPEKIHQPALQNFDQMYPLLQDKASILVLKEIEFWTIQQFKKYESIWPQRKIQGYIRNCHGDLHLKNIIYYQDRPILFDRLEFNEEFRWTDVMADIAFLIMDLQHKKQPLHANALLNYYLAETGDYADLGILPYYLVYRAIVRAKITLFTLKNSDISLANKKMLHEDYLQFIQLAQSYCRQKSSFLIITFGLSGSGKSTLAKKIAPPFCAVVLSSDIIRKQLFSLPSEARTASALNGGIYSEQAFAHTYHKLLQLTESILKAGYSIIVDATFLKREQRLLFENLAKEVAIPFFILKCNASEESLQTRISERLLRNDDPSEARLDVLKMQQLTLQPLTDEEKTFVLEIETNKQSSDEVINLLKNALASRLLWNNPVSFL